MLWEEGLTAGTRFVGCAMKGRGPWGAWPSSSAGGTHTFCAGWALTDPLWISISQAASVPESRSQRARADSQRPSEDLRPFSGTTRRSTLRRLSSRASCGPRTRTSSPRRSWSSVPASRSTTIICVPGICWPWGRKTNSHCHAREAQMGDRPGEGDSSNPGRAK